MLVPFRRDFVARPDHIDQLGHVNNAVWVQWMQELAVAHWRAFALPEHRERFYWVVTRHEIDYRGPAELGQRIIGETWVDGEPRGARFDRISRFIDIDDRVKLDARTTWAMIDAETHRPARITPEIVAPFLGTGTQ